VIQGRCYTKETLRDLMKFAQKNEIHLISDEVYALSVYDTGIEQTVAFTSVLSLNPEGLIDTDWLHVFYGLSKVTSLHNNFSRADESRILHPASASAALSPRTLRSKSQSQQTFAFIILPVCQ
jgi:DNA-binding transcriptional MocR family regulator